ncbi:FAD-dependent oxidoreductase [Pseudonocardia sp. 73-21]|uniref:FAD-dependent oxidoreductase n=1 Tax=Pseudonocardia sp. 73-21 TaxID=1895809 RepID=UPI000961DB03|nr:FAD-dependent oxidoreductase [Pseudonocardia sp. 73-21]OJY38843.1 MAG: hypothetical protein BGP03_28485 [Pseudonocardia sp. 73-21]
MSAAPTGHVVVVGGAVVGLSTALFLAHHGVAVTVVERHAAALRHPRARMVNPRTMELYRQVGIEEQLVAARSLTADLSAKTMIGAPTLAGPESFSTPMRDELPELTSDITPCTWCAIDQDRLEEIVAKRAAGLGVRLRFATECTGLTQDGEGVTVALRDAATGATETLRADYFVAADGGRSPVRTALGISSDGPGIFMETLSVVVQADLSAALRGRDLGLGYFEQPAPGTLLMPLDGSRWVFYTPHPTDGDAATVDDAVAVELFRAAIGQPDLVVGAPEVQIAATGETVLGFEIGAQVARSYRDRRVLLAGDAAHTMPPTGALGAGTGVQDAHNLAWKLAAVLGGTAGPELLDTYESERRPVAQLTMAFGMAEMADRTGDEDEEQRPGYAATLLGYVYREGAVVAQDTGADGPAALDPELLGRPGTRAPHVPLVLDGTAISSLDLYGSSFVLVAGPDGQSWESAVQQARDRLAQPLAVYRIGDGPTDPSGRWADVHGVGADGAVLVRPDGFVAWRAPGVGADPGAELLGALARVLSLPAPSRTPVSAMSARGAVAEGDQP